MIVAAFILVPHGSTDFGLHPDQHGSTGQKLNLGIVFPCCGKARLVPGDVQG